MLSSSVHKENKIQLTNILFPLNWQNDWIHTEGKFWYSVNFSSLGLSQNVKNVHIASGTKFYVCQNCFQVHVIVFWDLKLFIYFSRSWSMPVAIWWADWPPQSLNSSWTATKSSSSDARPSTWAVISTVTSWSTWSSCDFDATSNLWGKFLIFC